MNNGMHREPELPRIEELESVRKKLIQQIDDAEKTFSTERNGRELLTSKCALICVEEAIKRIRDRDAA